MAMHKMRQPRGISVVSGENMDCMADMNPAAGSGNSSPSHAIEVAMVSSSVEGTDSWRLDYQIVEVPGLDSGTGLNSAPENCKSPSRTVRVPVLVGCTLLRLIGVGLALRYRNLR